MALPHLSELAAGQYARAWGAGRMACYVYRLAVSDSLVSVAVSQGYLDEETHTCVRRDYEIYNAVI